MAALGRTGKAPGAPCKRCRAGSIPAFSTGFEEDGNPPRSGRGKTGFSSRGADHGCLVKPESRASETR